jgi:DNA-binding response OmpR family regulator
MKKRILILEDEKAVCHGLTQALGMEACEVVWTQTAHEALRRSLGELFDLAVLDLDVTDMDGWKAFDLFNRLHPFLPVVMLTDRTDQARRAMALGADACLEKPLDGRFAQTVKQLLAESPSARLSRIMNSLPRHKPCSVG